MRVVSTAVACSIVAQAMAPEVPVVPQQALDSHYLQRALSHELPLPLATWHGTHNSFNVNNRTGVFFEVPHNQIYDIDAQLRYLGVRYIEIDVHYIPEITEGTDADRAKVCHEDDNQALEIVAACNGEGFRDPASGNIVPGTVLSWEFCQAAGLYNFSRRTGCNLLAPTVTDELGKVHAWLQEPANSEQIVYIYFEDHISYLTADDHVLQHIVDASLPNMAFTTNDLNSYRATGTVGPADWPTPAQLVAMGKRVVIFNDAEDRSGPERCDGCKPPLQFQMRDNWGWPQLSVFDGPPGCMGKGSDRSAAALKEMQHGPDASSARAFYRVQGDATGYPLIHRPVDPVQLTAATAHKVMACGMWPQFDLLDEKRAAATRWSFADGESVSPALRSAVPAGQKRCATILGGDDLRWYLLPCHSRDPRRCACRNIAGGGWSLASPHQCLDGDCDDGDGEDCRAACPLRNGVFGAPRTPAEMNELAAAIQSARVPPRLEAEVEETVWLNAVEECTGCWRFNELTVPADGSERKLHCLPPLNTKDAVQHSCLDTASLGHCARGGTGCHSERWMGLSSNFTTFTALGLGVAVCVACGYRRSVYLESASPLKERLTEDEGFEMDVYATNTSVSSSWDLPGGGYTSPSGF